MDEAISPQTLLFEHAIKMRCFSISAVEHVIKQETRRSITTITLSNYKNDKKHETVIIFNKSVTVIVDVVGRHVAYNCLN